MSTQIEMATKRLFGVNGIGARNIKFFPGSSRDVTAEQLATELNKALSQIQAGAYKPATIDED